MSRSIALAVAIAAACCQAASADTAYTIHSWPGDLSRIPCDAWKHNEDGSWTQTGAITVEASSTVIKANTFRNGTDIAQNIDKKCAASK
jgi:hypothetical protein